MIFEAFCSRKGVARLVSLKFFNQDGASEAFTGHSVRLKKEELCSLLERRRSQTKKLLIYSLEIKTSVSLTNYEGKKRKKEGSNTSEQIQQK